MKKILITLVSILIFSGIGFGFAQKKYENPSFHAVVFTTVVSADTGSSVADKEVSSQGLSETIIGWTHSPLFSQKLGFGVAGKKQERQNIVLEFDAENAEISAENAEKMKTVLQAKLSEYNTLSQTEFALLFEETVVTENIPKKSMWILAGGIFGLFFGSFIAEFFFRRRKK